MFDIVQKRLLTPKYWHGMNDAVWRSPATANIMCRVLYGDMLYVCRTHIIYVHTAQDCSRRVESLQASCACPEAAALCANNSVREHIYTCARAHNIAVFIYIV